MTGTNGAPQRHPAWRAGDGSGWRILSLTKDTSATGSTLRLRKRQFVILTSEYWMTGARGTAGGPCAKAGRRCRYKLYDQSDKFYD